MLSEARAPTFGAWLRCTSALLDTLRSAHDAHPAAPVRVEMGLVAHACSSSAWHSLCEHAGDRTAAARVAARLAIGRRVAGDGDAQQPQVDWFSVVALRSLARGSASLKASLVPAVGALIEGSGERGGCGLACARKAADGLVREVAASERVAAAADGDCAMDSELQ